MYITNIVNEIETLESLKNDNDLGKSMSSVDLEFLPTNLPTSPLNQ